MMKINKKIRRFILSFIIITPLVMGFLTSSSQAKEITLQEAIEWGVQHNYDLEEARYNIETLKRDLAILDAGKALQVNLEVTPLWGLGGEEISLSDSQNSKQPSSGGDTNLLNLTAEKIIADDLNISASLSCKASGLTAGSLEEITEAIQANIQLEKQIYPQAYTQTEQQIFQTESNLKKKTEELAWEETEKQIDFLESYLNLSRLAEQLSLAEERQQLAAQELERVQEQIRLGEGGYQQEAEAKIALMEAENEVFNLKQTLTQQQKEWYLELNLPADTEVKLEGEEEGEGEDGEPAYLENLRSNMEELTIEEENLETLLPPALEKHYQIKNAYLDQESNLKEVERVRNEGKPQINFYNGYDLSEDYWYVMLDLSFKLADGGAQKLKEEEAEAVLSQQEKGLDQLVKTLQLEMKQLVAEDHYNQLNLQAKLAALEKEKSAKNILEKQYEEKIISSTQWQNQLMALAEEELKVKEAQDTLLINRLRLVHLLGL